MKTKIIAIEGVDSVGKETQSKLLKEWLSTFMPETSIHIYSYPDYSSATGKLVKNYLNGKYGNAADLHPEICSALYALDRSTNLKDFQFHMELEDEVLILDRYVYSNAAFQGAKIESQEAREAFYRQCEGIEFLSVGLPMPDVVVFLDGEPEQAQELMKKRAGQEPDQHEANLPLLKAAYRNYHELAELREWKVIPCIAGGQFRSKEAIALEVREAVKQILK